VCERHDAVEAGGLLAALAKRVEVVELVENRRRQDPEERFITTALPRSLTELAVRRLDEHGHIKLAHNSDQLRDKIVIDWWKHRADSADVVTGAPPAPYARTVHKTETVTR